MFNEVLLMFHIAIICCMAILSLRLGKEALVTFTVITILLANLFVLKQITLFSYDATSADALAVGSLLGFNLLQEFHSRALARKTIGITFAMLCMYVVLSQFHLLYHPSISDHTHEHFISLLAMAPWLTGGSMIIWMISQGTDFILFGILHALSPQKYFTIRNYIAIGTSQFIDTFLYTWLLSYMGIITHFASIFFISFSIKFLITLCATPVIDMAARRS